MTYTQTDDELILEADPTDMTYTQLAVAIAELRQEIAEIKARIEGIDFPPGPLL